MFLEKVYSGKNQWYYYIFTLLIVLFAWQFIGVLPLLAYTFFRSPELINHLLQTGNQETLQTALRAVMQTNGGLALTILSFIVGLSALWFCIQYIHGKKIQDVLTARSRVDGTRILFGAGVWALISLLTFAVQFIFMDTSDLVFRFEPLNFFFLLLISLTLLPFQASFEELLFRGYLMQWTAYLFKYRWVAVGLTGLLFGLMHGANPETEMGLWVVMPQYILMGLLLSYITVKDDGLELALGLHIANNILAAIIVTSDTSALQTHALFKILHPTASHWDTVIMLCSAIVFLWFCNRKFHYVGKINLWKKIDNNPKSEI